MANGPGPPLSPRGDADGHEPHSRPDQHPPGDGDTRPDDWSAGWNRPADWSAGWNRPASGPAQQPAQRPAEHRPPPGYGRERTAGGAPARGQQTSPLAPLADLRVAGDRRTGIRRAAG